jgi:hypothetical protein
MAGSDAVAGLDDPPEDREADRGNRKIKDVEHESHPDVPPRKRGRYTFTLDVATLESHKGVVSFPGSAVRRLTAVVGWTHGHAVGARRLSG